MDPFDVLFDAEPPQSLPAALQRTYGNFSLRADVVYSNFVQTIDGVVALAGADNAGSTISGRNSGDRLVMGLLRAAADAVLIGAGTLRGSPRHRWTADHVDPDHAAEFAALRHAWALKPRPLLVVVTGTGDIDVAHTGFQEPALILTTERGRERLASRLPPSCDVQALSDGSSLEMSAVLEHLHARGIRRLLSEAGPTVTGQLLDAKLLDELFLTVSPLVAGAAVGYDRLVAARRFLPERHLRATLVSVRRHGDHLFLRYRWTAVGNRG